MEDKLIFMSDDGEELKLELLEQATVLGSNYILAHDDDQAYILRCVEIEGEDILYEMLDEEETELIAEVFSKMLEDVLLV